ncbi:MAG TPA: TIGR00296 family protein [Aquifex sp.]|nr:TIGR00296 family protein [Aquifex sp.]
MINTDDAKVLINLARSAIEKALKGKNIDVPQWVREKYSQPAGVFVTLKKGGRLRGCIGLPYPVLPLWKATVHAALGAAFEDPRFPPLQSEEELNNTTFELTILTPPRELKVEDKRLLPQLIKVGRDGLIVEAMGRSGLLLPQVPIEQGWDSVTFLAHTCLKAGLPPDCWLWDKTKVKTFQGLVFEELSPRGEVVKRESA